MVAGRLGAVRRWDGRGPPRTRRQEQHHLDAQACKTPRSRRLVQALFQLPGSYFTTRATPITLQVSYLIDTDLLSMLERKQVPPKLGAWVQANESDIFLSVVSFAELQFGLDRAPVSHQAGLAAWLADIRRKLAPATEELSEPVLVRWKALLSELKVKNRTMTCEDSLIAATALYHNHTVATRNQRHFEPSGVQAFDPLS